eukprot:Hpha_TRINITY_DN27602_c0_g1::TRINITY_DN27602_c0_g1_i1::g.57465::m.57465
MPISRIDQTRVVCPPSPLRSPLFVPRRVSGHSGRETLPLHTNAESSHPMPLIACPAPSLRRHRNARAQRRLSHPALSSIALLTERIRGDNLREKNPRLTMLFAAGTCRNRLLFAAASSPGGSSAKGVIGQTSATATPTPSPAPLPRARRDMPSPLERRGSAERRRRGASRGSTRSNARRAVESETVLAVMALHAVKQDRPTAPIHQPLGAKCGSETPRSQQSDRLFQLSTQAAADKKRQKHEFPTYNGLPGFYRAGSMRSRSAQHDRPRDQFKRSATPQPRTRPSPQSVLKVPSALPEQATTPAAAKPGRIKLSDIVGQASPPDLSARPGRAGVETTPVPATRSSPRYRDSTSRARLSSVPSQYSEAVGTDW